MGELAASRAVHLLLREASAGGIFPQIGTKLHIIDHEQCLSYVCVLLYYSCCGAADKLSPREKEVGGLWRARRGGIDTNGD